MTMLQIRTFDIGVGSGVRLQELLSQNRAKSLALDKEKNKAGELA
jgi:hypothetical protein